MAGNDAEMLAGKVALLAVFSLKSQASTSYSAGEGDRAGILELKSAGLKRKVGAIRSVTAAFL